MLTPPKVLILPGNNAFLTGLISLLSVGAVACVAAALLAMIALIYVTAFLLQLCWCVLMEVTTYALHTNMLTQVLLIAVIGYLLSKVYPLIGRGLRASAVLFCHEREVKR